MERKKQRKTERNKIDILFQATKKFTWIFLDSEHSKFLQPLQSIVVSILVSTNSLPQYKKRY